MSKNTSLIDSFPFSSLLDSNYIPLDEEVIQINDFLAQPRKQLKEMKAEMDRLQAELDSVKSKYYNLYHQISSCASLVTLPRRIPDDVLQEIFYQTLPTDRNAFLDKNAAPLIFTRICRQWRQVAFATPRLWSTIHIHVEVKPELEDPWNDSGPGVDVLSNKPPRHNQDELRATAALEWLKRSGDLPLRVSFVANEGLNINAPAVDPYLDLLVPFSSRWKSLVFEGDSPSFSRIFTFEAASLRSLESLILDFTRMGPDGNLEAGPQLLSSLSNCGLLTTPSLRKLSIRGVVMGHTTVTSFNVDWTQLTHLELCAPSGSWGHDITMPMSTASEILQVSTRLVYCRIGISGWAPSSPSDIYSMQLPLLRHLSMGIKAHIFPFMEKLEAPRLQEIDLHIIETDIPGNDIDYKTCFAPLFQPQQGSIQKLIIDTRYLDHESFLEILRKCPHLGSLTLKRVPDYGLHTAHPRVTPPITIDDIFLESISSNNGEILCSQLEEFICDYPATFSTTGLIEFIKRKQDGSIPKLAKLKKVDTMPPRVGRKKDPHEQRRILLCELQPYISRGLTLHISGLYKSFSDGGVYGNSAGRNNDSWWL